MRFSMNVPYHTAKNPARIQTIPCTLHFQPVEVWSRVKPHSLDLSLSFSTKEISAQKRDRHSAYTRNYASGWGLLVVFIEFNHLLGIQCQKNGAPSCILFLLSFPLERFKSNISDWESLILNVPSNLCNFLLTSELLWSYHSSIFRDLGICISITSIGLINLFQKFRRVFIWFLLNFLNLDQTLSKPGEIHLQ